MRRLSLCSVPAALLLLLSVEALAQRPAPPPPAPPAPPARTPPAPAPAPNAPPAAGGQQRQGNQQVNFDNPENVRGDVQSPNGANSRPGSRVRSPGLIRVRDNFNRETERETQNQPSGH